MYGCVGVDEEVQEKGGDGWDFRCLLRPLAGMRRESASRWSCCPPIVIGCGGGWLFQLRDSVRGWMERVTGQKMAEFRQLWCLQKNSDPYQERNRSISTIRIMGVENNSVAMPSKIHIKFPWMYWNCQKKIYGCFLGGWCWRLKGIIIQREFRNSMCLVVGKVP